MKVLFMVNLPSPYRAMFFSELGKLCDLTVMYERASASDRDKRWKADEADTYKTIFLKGKEVGADNSFCPEILRYLKKEKYDYYVVGMYSTYTAMLAITYFKLSNIPFILSTDGGFVGHESKIKYIIKRHFIKAASNWLSTSDKASEYLMHYGAKKEEIYLYPFTSLKERDLREARELTEETRKAIKSELNIKEEKVILGVGQFIYRKGFDLLIKAAKNLSENIGVYIVGGEPTEEYLSLAKGLNDRIHFIGFVGKEEVAKYYKCADIFVLPTREDIWGLVVNEALSYGTPCITTNRCGAGCALIKDGVNGYIVPTNNDKELVTKINSLLNSKSRDIRKACIESVENYTIEKMAKRHIEIFDFIGRNNK